jgi:ribonuclease I
MHGAWPNVKGKCRAHLAPQFYRFRPQELQDATRVVENLSA